ARTRRLLCRNRDNSPQERWPRTASWSSHTPFHMAPTVGGAALPRYLLIRRTCDVVTGGARFSPAGRRAAAPAATSSPSFQAVPSVRECVFLLERLLGLCSVLVL